MNLLWLCLSILALLLLYVAEGVRNRHAGRLLDPRYVDLINDDNDEAEAESDDYELESVISSDVPTISVNGTKEQ